MQQKTPATFPLILAVGFFTVWLGLLYAGADHPPPWGFLRVFPFDAVGAWIVYMRTPLYIQWSRTRLKHRLFRVFLEGVAVGLLFAFMVRLLPGTGEPGIPPPGWVDIMIWFGVVAAVGAANACGVYFFSTMIARK